uniref:Uncharacterized protein n=1 Tax=Seriola dumerili TaxID=41447 RepID=A0A3B4TU35_SERDU
FVLLCVSVRFVICTNDTFRYRPTLDVNHQSKRKVSFLYSPGAVYKHTSC